MSRVRSLAPFLLAPLAFASLLAGCPDPNPVGSYDEYGAGGAAASAGANAGPGAAKSDPGATKPDSARWKCGADSDCIDLKGTFEYAGTQTGMYRLDFQAVGDGPPRLAHTLELKGTGEWSVKAPKDAGPVRVVAFIDLKGDGPSKGDPGAIAEVSVGAEAPDVVTMTLTDDFDIAALAPQGGPGGFKNVAGDPTAAGPGENPAPDGAPGGQAPAGEPPSGPAPGEAGGPPADGAAPPQ